MPDNIPESAMVFAAGFGTRMLPLTADKPKALVKVKGKPLLDYALDKLTQAGVLSAVVNTHYLAGMIENHVARRKSPKVLISHEPEILETGGGIVKALPILGSKPFYVINSDILWTEGKIPALEALAAMWDVNKMDALLMLANVNGAIGYDGKGDFNLLPDGTLTRDKGAGYEFVYAGVMIIKPGIFVGKKAEPFSIFRDFIFKEPKYNRENGAMPKIYGYIHTGKWLHVGTPDSIKPAEEVL